MADQPERKELKRAIGIAVVIFIVWALSGFLIWRKFHDSSERGQFGDMFGAINALFSGLAFGGVIYALWSQRKEARETQQKQQEHIDILARQLKTMEDRFQFERQKEEAASQPLLSFWDIAHIPPGYQNCTFKVHNGGGTITNVKPICPDDVEANFPPVLPQGETKDAKMWLPDGVLGLNVTFTIRYMTRLGIEGQRLFRLKPDRIEEVFPNQPEPLSKS